MKTMTKLIFTALVALAPLFAQALEPLPIVLPKPLFEGTPENLRVPNLEKPLGKPRPRLFEKTLRQVGEDVVAGAAPRRDHGQQRAREPAGARTQLENAQPIMARFKGGVIALAHNGNLTNAAEIRADLEMQGSIFTSTMDSEVLLHRLARSNHDDPIQRLTDALAGVEGAYSIVVLINQTLLAARRAFMAML